VNRETPEHDDDVARLIRLADTRREAPPEATARARWAVRTAWQDGLRRRARRRRIQVGVGLAVAASLILAVGLLLRPATPSAPTLYVQSLAGQARVRPAGDPAAGTPLRQGDPVAVGAEIVTDPDGRVGLGSAAGYSIRLDAGTRVALLGERRLDLLSGALYLDSGSESHRTPALEVRTLYGTARPVGTQFEVRLADDAVRVRVRRGIVQLTGSRGAHEIRAGGEVRLDALGEASRRDVEPYGSDWAWVERVMPGYDIDGRPVRGLLDWASREAGWRLAFADAETERQAAETTLTGSIEGLSVEEALQAVLPASSMGFEVEDGTLTVFRAGSPR